MMMRSIFLQAIAAVFILSWSARAAAFCEPQPPAQINVRLYKGPVSYDFTKDLAGLQAVTEEGWVSVLPSDRALGLTKAELRVNLQSRMQMQTDPDDGMVCGRLSTLDIDLGFPQPVIYVAREFPRRSCAHREILAHEEVHVRINRRFLEEFDARLRSLLRGAVADLRAVRGTSSDDVKQRINRVLNDRLEVIMQQAQTDLARRHQQLDTPEEYRRVSMSCNGEIQQILRKKQAEQSRQR